MKRTALIVVGQVFNTLWGTLVSLLFATSDKLECKSSRRRGDEIDDDSKAGAQDDQGHHILRHNVT